MAIESAVAKTTFDVVDNTRKMVEEAFKKAWSILDAASEKRTPSKAISQNAIRAIQGNTKGIDV
jgi:hypothetical protein